MTLDPTFVLLMQSMLTEAINSTNAIQNQQLNKWYLADLSLWNGNVLDINAIGAAFDREEVGIAYGETIVSADGATGEAASCTLQSDYMAVMERAFRARHASPIRSKAHAAARRLGHGDAVGCIQRVTGYAQDLLTAGG